MRLAVHADSPALQQGVRMAAAYSIRHFALRSLRWTDLWWNTGGPGQYLAKGTTDADGIPLYLWRGHYYYHPVRIELQGLKRIDGYAQTHDNGYIPTLQAFDLKLRSMAIESNGAWFLPDTFDYTPEGLHSPWYNTMSQGIGLAFFVRMYRIFGDPADLEWATRLFHSFEVIGPISRPWVAQVERHYLWLEHYPNGYSLHVLNAHLHALFGLYDYWQETLTTEARAVLEGAITTMRDNVSRFRRKGTTSLYCLVHPTSTMHYHHLHVKQLKQLALVSGDDYFAKTAARFRRDAW
jgi:D-glucuronyl C5-epimerase C-terminus